MPEVPSWSEEQTWEVVYKAGVTIRKSATYNDNNLNGDKLECGEIFRGTAGLEYCGNGEMVRIANDRCEWVPPKTFSAKGGSANGKTILRKVEAVFISFNLTEIIPV